MDTENGDVAVKETKAESTIKTQKKPTRCRIKGCKRPYRAKGYCTVHYHQWRQGKLTKPRYKTCNFGVKKLKRNEKKECLKRIFQSGLCEEHFKASLKKQEQPASAAPAAAAATPAT